MTGSERLPVVLWGAGGLLAGEFLRLLAGHPDFELDTAVARTPGPLRASHPHLTTRAASVAPQIGVERLVTLAAAGPCALVLSLPHGESTTVWSELRAALGEHLAQVLVVDLAADFRLRDPALAVKTYGQPTPDEGELAGWAYGLPELFRADLDRARRVAAPGCFATALQLATLPAARAGLLAADRTFSYAGVTGSSGSGAKPKPGTHHPHRHGNLWAYALDGHRHEAELVQALARESLAPDVHFVPHSGPFVRGIHLTAFLPLARAVESDEALAVYAGAYEGQPFVDVLEGESPDLRRVVGSNRVALTAAVRGALLTVTLTLDNVVKGGAGQALQCLNLVAGSDECAGLPRDGMGVC